MSRPSISSVLADAMMPWPRTIAIEPPAGGAQAPWQRGAGVAAGIWLPPLILVALALYAHVGGLDRAIADATYDAASGRFPWRESGAMELLGHRLMRSLATGAWVALALATLATVLVRRLHAWRRLLVATTLAMALGPAIVVVLKSFTAFPCPWSLARYGGVAAEASRWFTTPAAAGHCFPAGHAAGGFSLLALAFGLAAAGRRRPASIMLAVALAFGTVAAAVRTLQGAHFLSHSLWSAAIDWWVAAAIIAHATGPGRTRTTVSPPRWPPGRR
jgi:membrane-associated PAP2 superfamily phosphatase